MGWGMRKECEGVRRGLGSMKVGEVMEGGREREITTVLGNV
jgi:hypothetical protein